MRVEEALRRVNERIRTVCQRIGCDAGQIELVLVTKEVAPELIKEVYELGIRDFGENRVQDLVAKQNQLSRDIKWHFIGHLQTNKVKQLLGVLDAKGRPPLLHSLDRMDLASELQKQAARGEQTVDVLIQVNTSREQSKYGFSPDEAEQAISQILTLERLKVRGLMTIGPLTDDEGRIRDSFRRLRDLRDRLRRSFPEGDWYYLSMGMSSDFEIAIEEGSNLLRIGTAVFGKRPAVR